MSTALQVKEAFDKVSWKYKDFREMPDKSTIMLAGFNGDKATINLLMHFDAMDHTVMFRVLNLSKVPIDRKYEVFSALNRMNAVYRWIRFFVDDEESIVAQVDHILIPDESADVVMELIVRINQVVNEAFPEIMKAVWG